MWSKIWDLIDSICLHLGEAQRSMHRGVQIPIGLLPRIKILLEEVLRLVKELDK